MLCIPYSHSPQPQLTLTHLLAHTNKECSSHLFQNIIFVFLQCYSLIKNPNFKMKKLVLALDLQNVRKKQKAMSKVSGISGVISVAVDMKEKKMTVIGEVDAVEVTSKLRKLCHADIVTLGENKEDSKKEGGGGGGQVVEAYPWFHYPYAYPQVSYAEGASKYLWDL